MSSKFCPLPFAHINIKPNGKTSACWRNGGSVGDYNTKSFTEIWNDKPLVDLRKSLMNGEQPSSCQSCWDMEKSGTLSTRERSIKDYEHIVTEDQARKYIDNIVPISNVQSIEVRVGNACNLMCRHCGPEYSSMWENAIRKDPVLKSDLKSLSTFDFNSPERSEDLSVERVTEIKEIISGGSITEIMWSGGEPLFHNAHYEILESAQQFANQISLSYSSNLNKLSFGKNRSVLELWKPFKKVNLRISFDADDKIYSYVRTGGNVKLVEDNIEKVRSLSNVVILGSVTASIFNMTRLLDIVKYMSSIGIMFHASIVQYPPSLNPKLLHPDLKAKITTEVQDFLSNTGENIKSLWPGVIDGEELKTAITRVEFYCNYLLKYMNAEDRFAEWPNFVKHAKSLDRINATTYLEVYPEFKPYE